jgi:hypothetical protein
MDTIGFTLGGGVSETETAAPGSSIYDRARKLVQKGMILPVKYNPEERNEEWYAVFNFENNIRKNTNSFMVENELERYAEIITGNSDGKTEFEELLDLYGTFYNRALVRLELALEKMNKPYKYLSDDWRYEAELGDRKLELTCALQWCEKQLLQYEIHKTDTSCGICACGSLAESSETQKDGSEVPVCDICYLSRPYNSLRKTATMGGLEEDNICLCGRITPLEDELYVDGPIVPMCIDCKNIRETSHLNEI